MLPTVLFTTIVRKLVVCDLVKVAEEFDVPGRQLQIETVTVTISTVEYHKVLFTYESVGL